MVRTLDFTVDARGVFRHRRPTAPARRRNLGYVSPNGVTGTVLPNGTVQYNGAALGLPFDVFMQQGEPVYGPLVPPPGTNATPAFTYAGTYGPNFDNSGRPLLAPPAPTPRESTLLPAFNPSKAGIPPQAQQPTTPAGDTGSTTPPPAGTGDTSSSPPPSGVEIVGDPRGIFEDILNLLPDQLQDFIRNTAAQYTPTQWAAIAGVIGLLIYTRHTERKRR
jgi:hypothetical protein